MKIEKIPKETKLDHAVVVPNFFWEGKDLEAWQLGWSYEDKCEAKSSVSRKIFDHYIYTVGLNMIFYYVDDGNFYGIHMEEYPAPVFRFRKEPAEYIAMQLGYKDTHNYETEEILYMVDYEKEDFWEIVKIDGKSLGEVLQRSYILSLL